MLWLQLLLNLIGHCLSFGQAMAQGQPQFVAWPAGSKGHIELEQIPQTWNCRYVVCICNYWNDEYCVSKIDKYNNDIYLPISDGVVLLHASNNSSCDMRSWAPSMASANFNTALRTIFPTSIGQTPLLCMHILSKYRMICQLMGSGKWNVAHV